jgi:magnesium chelatase subunit I
MPKTEFPRTLGELRTSQFAAQISAGRTLKEELRSNLICKLERGETLFPGVMGYEDTVVPQVVNAILSHHNFILLGLRGQAKTRLARMLTRLLDANTRGRTLCREIGDAGCHHCRHDWRYRSY